MKKFFICVIAVISGISTSFATRTDAGTWTAGIDFSFDSNTSAGSSTYFKLDIGRFFEGGHLCGGSLMYDGNSYSKLVSVGPCYEYNIYDSGNSPFVFYIGGQLHFAHMASDICCIEDATAALFGARLGMRFFLAEMTALDVGVSGFAATDDIYLDKDGAKNTNVIVSAGLRFFL